MEEINKKAMYDELNKAHEEIGRAPKKYIPVPKIKKNKKDENDTKES